LVSGSEAKVSFMSNNLSKTPFSNWRPKFSGKASELKAEGHVQTNIEERIDSSICRLTPFQVGERDRIVSEYSTQDGWFRNEDFCRRELFFCGRLQTLGFK
jgi:hypothetical protein